MKSFKINDWIGKYVQWDRTEGTFYVYNEYVYFLTNNIEYCYFAYNTAGDDLPVTYKYCAAFGRIPSIAINIRTKVGVPVEIL